MILIRSEDGYLCINLGLSRDIKKIKKKTTWKHTAAAGDSVLNIRTIKFRILKAKRFSKWKDQQYNTAYKLYSPKSTRWRQGPANCPDWEFNSSGSDEGFDIKTKQAHYATTPMNASCGESSVLRDDKDYNSERGKNNFWGMQMFADLSSKEHAKQREKQSKTYFFNPSVSYCWRLKVSAYDLCNTTTVNVFKGPTSWHNNYSNQCLKAQESPSCASRDLN